MPKKIIVLPNMQEKEQFDLVDITFEYLPLSGKDPPKLFVTFWFGPHGECYTITPKYNQISLFVNDESLGGVNIPTYHDGNYVTGIPMTIETYQQAPQVFRREYLMALIICVMSEIYGREEVCFGRQDGEWVFLEDESIKDLILDFVYDWDTFLSNKK